MQIGFPALKLVPVRQVTALLIVVVTALTLGLRAAEATPCKGPGESCLRSQSCCSRQCVGAIPGRRPTFGKCAGANGDPCTVDGDCLSTHCVGGVCCNTACTGDCEGCAGGTCANSASGVPCDDGLFCNGTDTCDGMGTCVHSGTPCPAPCDGCEEPDACTVGGVPCGLEEGQPCSQVEQCNSTYCVDGVCCEAACDGTCEACSAAKTGGTDGTCRNIPPGDDPDAECPEGQCVTGDCGAGACGSLPSSTQCDDDRMCSETDHCDGAGTCVGTGNGCPGTCICEVPDTCTQEGDPCTQ